MKEVIRVMLRERITNKDVRGSFRNKAYPVKSGSKCPRIVLSYVEDG